MYKKTGYGYGKTILFGEHFVVYGFSAIVCALSSKTKATVEDLYNSEELFELIDSRPKHPNFKPTLQKEYNNLVQNILHFFNISQKVKITLSGDLTVCSGGIGASAACAVSIARAVNNYFKLGCSDKQINQAAYEGEKALHGNPSGIDNTAAMLGGLFSFKQNNIEKIIIKEPIEIVLVDSEIENNTKSVLREVKIFKDNNPEKFNKLTDEFNKLYAQAKRALLDFDLKTIGILMTQNHNLLKRLNLSCDEIENIIDIAKDNGAYGAKITGTGKGGLVLVLTPGKSLQETVAQSLQKQGFFAFKTTIG